MKKAKEIKWFVIFLCTGLSLWITGCPGGKDETKDTEPIATASAVPTTGVVPLMVNFTGSVNNGNIPFTYEWDFGDGTGPSTEQNPTHTYTDAGTFTATFTVTDADGDSDTDSTEIIVNTTANIPTANASADKTSGTAPLTVNFTGIVIGGDVPFTYEWDFGDGTGPSTEQNPTHTYTDAGTFTATFTVIDNTDDSDSDSVVIIVNVPPLPPSVTGIEPVSGIIGTIVVISGSDFGDNQDSSTVTFNGVDAGIAAFWSDTRITNNVPPGASTGPVVVTVGGEPSNADVIFTVLTGTIIGNVSDSIGSVSGATVDLATDIVFANIIDSTITNASGNYTFTSVAAGIYYLRATEGAKIGYYPGQIVLGPGDTAVADIFISVMDRTISGTIVEGSGWIEDTIVFSAQIFDFAPVGRRFTLVANGGGPYTLYESSDPGLYYIMAAKDINGNGSYDMGEPFLTWPVGGPATEIDVTVGDATGIDFTLPSHQTINGKVIGAPSWKVAAAEESILSLSLPTAVTVTNQDAGGNYVLDVFAGFTYVVAAFYDINGNGILDVGLEPFELGGIVTTPPNQLLSDIVISPNILYY